MTIYLVSHHRKTMEADAQKALGLIPAGRSILAPIATANYSGQHVRDELADCLARGQFGVLWVEPEMGQIAAGNVDVKAIPSHPDVKDLADAIKEHGKPVIARILFEFANKRLDGTRNFIDGPTYVSLFDAIASQMPENAIPSWCFEPSQQGIVFGEWRPKLAKVAGCDFFDQQSVSPSYAKGKNARAFLQAAAMSGLKLACWESCFTKGDITKADAAVADFYAPLLKLAVGFNMIGLCLFNDPHAFAGTDSGRYAPGAAFPPGQGQPPWPGSPGVVIYLAKKLASPLFGKAQKLALSEFVA